MNRGCLPLAGRGLAVIVHVWLATLCLAVLVFTPHSRAATQEETNPFIWQSLVERLAKDGWDRDTVNFLYTKSGAVFDPNIMGNKVDALTERRFAQRTQRPEKQSDLGENPSEIPLEQSGYRYYLKPWVIAWAREYTKENQALLERAYETYGVPTEFQVAILLVESKLGSTLGDRKAFDVLSSMALTADFSLLEPHLESLTSTSRREYAKGYVAKRAQWAYTELSSLLKYASANNQDPTTIPSSIYGAIGICQFIPSNALRYGVDGNGDGRVDLFLLEDAIPSLANYLKQHGWTADLTEDERDKILFAYNHSTTYVRAISSIAVQLKNLSDDAPYSGGSCRASGIRHEGYPNQHEPLSPRSSPSGHFSNS
ncbi:lytic murein transglycosylase [Desulfovibrio inopinatus]|uniref:lytic murein transglycosylase n=1 Tax=Desulfovibrio inopinatus TaxID=102109 RepID=UPI000416F405|nr:lytic murein transglycosylase [Desulfovibrio inopinatus]